MLAKQESYDTVAPDHFHGAVECIERAVDRGARRIAYLSTEYFEQCADPSFSQRRRAYEEVVSRLGGEPTVFASKYGDAFNVVEGKRLADWIRGNGRGGPVGSTKSSGRRGPVGSTKSSGRRGPVGSTKLSGRRGPVGSTKLSGRRGPPVEALFCTIDTLVELALLQMHINGISARDVVVFGASHGVPRSLLELHGLKKLLVVRHPIGLVGRIVAERILQRLHGDGTPARYTLVKAEVMETEGVERSFDVHERHA